MAKDPFANLPPIEPEDRLEHDNAPLLDHVDNTTDVSAGSPPRTLLKNAGKWAVPAMGLAIGVWLFMPTDPNIQRRAVPSAPVEVDTAKQANETESMIKNMKEEAAKKPPLVVPVMPGSPAAQGSTAAIAAKQSAAVQPGSATGGMVAPAASGTYTAASGRPPLPPGYTMANGSPTPTPIGHPDKEAAEKSAQMYEAAMKRQEEIRASAIEVSKVRLIGQAANAEASKPDALASLKADLGDSEKVDAVRSQQAMQEKILAAMAPKEPVKSKGANEEFLAANAGASDSSVRLTRQMAPQAAMVINEGHIIRAVMLTRVNSDLPGRVLARVTSDVYDSTQRHVIIPKGSQLIGVYSSQVMVGQERLLMAMNRLILPNGSWMPLSGAGAADMGGMSGVRADVNNHFMKMFGSSLILGASTLLLPRQDTTVGALQGIAGGAGGTTGSIFATSLNEVLKTLLERNKQIPPTLSLKEGEEFIFMVAHDISVVPYKP